MNFTDSFCNSKLSFEPSEFHSELFSVDEFIQRKRQNVPLDVLRDDLGSHLKFLRSSLIELINQDYGQFVNLSSNLVGLDSRIQNIFTPLTKAQKELQELYNNLDSIISSLNSELSMKNQIRSSKAQLQFLRQTQKALVSAEKYIQNVPFEVVTSSDYDYLKSASHEIAETKFLLAKCNNSVLSQNFKDRCNAVAEQIFSRLAGFIEIYGNLPHFTSDGESDSAAMVKSLLFMYYELKEVKKAEEIFVEKVVKPKCNLILAKKGNMFALIDEFEVFIDKCPLIIVSKDIANSQWLTNYDFISRGIFPTIVNIISKHFPHISSPSSPDSFHSNWRKCEAFIDRVESSLPSIEHLLKFRDSDELKDFVSKWQFTVYFQLRFHSLAIELETALDKFDIACTNSEFNFDSTRVLMRVILQCWDEKKIFISHICGKFLKATAIFVSRYLNELSHNVSTKKSIDELMKLYLDLNASELKAKEFLVDKMKQVNELFSCDNSERYITGFTEQWTESRLLIETKVIELSLSQSNSGISSVTEIPRLFRRTNRDVPTANSEYVETILAPLLYIQEFARDTLWDKVGQTIGDKVQQRYYSQVQEVLTSVSRMEESLKRLKKVKGQNQNKAINSAPSDDDKIRRQIQFDIYYFSDKLKLICPNLDTSEIRGLIEKTN